MRTASTPKCPANKAPCRRQCPGACFLQANAGPSLPQQETHRADVGEHRNGWAPTLCDRWVRPHRLVAIPGVKGCKWCDAAVGGAP